MCISENSQPQDSTKRPLKAKIITSSDSPSIVLLEFNQPILQLSQKEIESALKFSNEALNLSTYHLNMIHEQKDLIKIDFLTNRSYSKTRINLEVTQPTIFRSEDGVELSEINSVSLRGSQPKKLSFQLPMFLKEEEGLSSKNEAMDRSVGAIVGLSIAASASNFFFTSDLSLLWSILNSIQIASFMLMLNIRYPKNTKDFLKVLLNSHLKFLPDFIVEKFNLKSSRFVAGLKVIDENQRAPERFNDLGISTNILENCALYFQIFVFYHLIHLLFNFLCKLFRNNKLGLKLMKLSKYLNYTILIFVNNFLFLDITLYSMLQLNNLSQQSFQFVFQGVLAFLGLAWALLFMAWVFYILQRPESEIVTPEFAEKYKLLVEDVSRASFFSKNFNLFLILQRFLFCFCLVVLHDIPLMSLIILLISQILIILIHLIFKPLGSFLATIMKISENIIFMVLYAISIAIHSYANALMHKHDFIDYEEEITYIDAGWAFNCIIIILLAYLMAYNIFRLAKTIHQKRSEISDFLRRCCYRRKTLDEEKGLTLKQMTDTSFDSK